MPDLPSRTDWRNDIDLCFPLISFRCLSKIIGFAPSDLTLTGVTSALVFHSFCTSTQRSWFFKISSSLCLTLQIRGTAMSITLVLCFGLSITTISSLRAGISLSVWISTSRNTVTFIFFITGTGWCFSRSLTCLTPIQLTYIPVKNYGYIVVTLHKLLDVSYGHIFSIWVSLISIHIWHYQSRIIRCICDWWYLVTKALF